MSTARTNEIEKTASEWLIRRDSRQWTEADQARFEQWLEASTLNRVAYLRLELAWEDAGRLKALGAGIHADDPPPPGQWNLSAFFEEVAPRQKGGSRKFLASAASILVAALAGGAYYFWPAGHAYETPIGGIASVPMTDGSNVTLNTDSEIRVLLNDSERRIDLKSGEAFFDVAKDLKRPFVVYAGGRRVVALGTKFSVRRDIADIQVVVTEGKVRIEDAGETFLTPGSIARASDAGVVVQRKTLSEAEEQLSWRTGILVFRDQSLASAVAEFNRYNTRKIAIEDPALADLKIEGNFRATNLDAFVRLLESGFSLRVTERQDRIMLTSK